MDMPSSSSMGSGSSMSNSTMDSMPGMDMMKMYLHFTPGDILLFDTIVPSSAGAIFGACLIFFIVSIFYRWLRAFSRGVEYSFAARANRLSLSRVDSERSSDRASVTKGLPPAEAALNTLQISNPKFIFSSEITRGVLVGIEETLHYLLMLVAMTFNVSYVISIILGAVVGEMAFGRLNRNYVLASGQGSCCS
ncbi:hypothetical protein DENSPDRAFT_833975 [Dentipellis sp. KUC8613]|nr:hypothetical protein DENSPDRAFT_833975 [Dentipellis sp. KUC8613]